jgi:hypothetical protein
MGGFVFRLGTRLKDWGERLKWNWLVRLGLGLELGIRDFVLSYGVVTNGKIQIR